MMLTTRSLRPSRPRSLRTSGRTGKKKKKKKRTERHHLIVVLAALVNAEDGTKRKM